MINSFDELDDEYLGYIANELDARLEAIFSVDYDIYTSVANGNITITTKCSKDKEMMPTIHLYPEIEDDIVYVVPELSFPTLAQGELDFADSMHYWLGKWYAVGGLITIVNNLSFNINDIFDIDDEE